MTLTLGLAPLRVPFAAWLRSTPLKRDPAQGCARASACQIIETRAPEANDQMSDCSAEHILHPAKELSARLGHVRRDEPLVWIESAGIHNSVPPTKVA